MVRRLGGLTDRLAAGLTAAAAEAGVAERISVVAMPALVTLFLSPDPPTDFAGAQAADHERYGALCRALLERGIYPPPSQYEAWFVSLAHDEAAIDRTCSAVGESLAEVYR